VTEENLEKEEVIFKLTLEDVDCVLIDNQKLTQKMKEKGITKKDLFNSYINKSLEIYDWAEILSIDIDCRLDNKNI
jgi:hypothetical protein